MLKENQINKWINFFHIIEGVIGDYSLRGYDGETILDSEEACPICGTKLNDLWTCGPLHELYFDFPSGTFWCYHQYQKQNEGTIIDFVMKVKKLTREEAVMWINDYIKE